MPNYFDWIFKRDPFWRERPKEEALAIPRSRPTDARETRTSLRRSIGSQPSSQARRRPRRPGPTSNEKGEEVTAQVAAARAGRPKSANRRELA